MFTDEEVILLLYIIHDRIVHAITRDLDGKRVRHVHPLRVYLIASVIFFLVINFLSKNAHLENDRNPDHSKLTLAVSGPTPIPLVAPTPSLGFSLGISALPAPSASPSPEDEGNLLVQIDGKEKQSGFEGWLEKRAKEKIGPTGDRGDLFLKTLIQNVAPMVLCCIPLFALVLKILYVFKRRFYVEHLVFALHTHAFVFLSALVIIGIGFLLHWNAPPPFTPLVCTFLGFAVVFQLLRAIRNVYRQNWLATLFKFGLGSVIYIVMLSLAFGITAFVTLALP